MLLARATASSDLENVEGDDRHRMVSIRLKSFVCQF
jgi:hypothetical protein